LRTHPLWLVGFRPFFALACLSGLSLPVLWALIFSGSLTPPPAPFSPSQWHAHEMFFGFGWAVLGGFLLTSTKNWVKVRGYHGTALIVLVARLAARTRRHVVCRRIATIDLPPGQQPVPRHHRRHAAVDADPPPSRRRLPRQLLLPDHPAAVPGRQEPAAQRRPFPDRRER
jgi:hypothetical protein